MSGAQALERRGLTTRLWLIASLATIRSVHHMIPRYTRPEMGRIWSDQNKFQAMARSGTGRLEALAELGVVPAEAARLLRAHAGFDVERIDEIESESKARRDRLHHAVAETMAAAGHGESVALVPLRPDVERRRGYGAGAAAAAGVGDSAARIWRSCATC